MQYRQLKNLNLSVSALGFGAMRLPTLPRKDSDEHDINKPEAIKILRAAIDNGVTYVDTAYGYHNGQSEVVVGEALTDGYRERVLLATKLPLWNINQTSDFDTLLNTQLKRLNVECIDFYLFHAVDKDKWENKILKFDLIKKMEQAKEEGKIKHIGFSFHDNLDVFKTIIDGYDKWEFCQVQFNYIDTDNQAGIAGVEYAAAKNIPVIVMEPLLGGKLANPPKNLAATIPNDINPVHFALDYIWNRPEVATVLSGMSDMEQVTGNIEYANKSGIAKLSDSQLEIYATAKIVYDTMALVACTSCGYCMPCPAGIDIPKTYQAYNRTSGSLGDAIEMYDSISVPANDCIACGACEKVCPQQIKSTELMPMIDEFFIRNSLDRDN